VDRLRVEQLSRDTGLVDDPQACGRAVSGGGDEGDPVVERARRPSREVDGLIAIELIAVEVESAYAQAQLVGGVGRQQL